MTILTGGPSLKAAAEACAEAGRVVLPLGGDDKKKPLVRWRELAPGPRHVLQVRCWWRRWPEANIGLRTGSGLVVIDVDTRHGGAVDPSWPATRASQTRSGGYHLFYASEALVRCSVATMAVGVDVRGEGGYVVVPPSPGWSWINDEPLAALPPSLVTKANAARRVQAGSTSQGYGGSRFEFRESVGEGERNDYLARYAGWLYAQGYSEWEVLDSLNVYNEGGCVPSLDPDEVARIATNIARYHNGP